jgi:ABC-type Mn2+/Zn2+ transport system permease subunit
MGGVIETLTDPFSTGIGLRALLEVAILGAACAPFGVWIVLYRQSYAAESVAHAMLPGLVGATLIGAPLGLGAAAGLAVAAVAITLAARQSSVSADTAIAVVVTTLFGLGTLLALSPDVPVRLGDLLFGNPLSVSERDIAASAALAVVLIGAMAVGHRALSIVGFDAGTAPSLGVRPAPVTLAVLALLALTTLIAVGSLGNLLVVAIVIAPAAAALRLTRRLVPALVAAGALGVTAGIGGLYLSHYADLAAGASIALCAVATFGLALAATARVGRFTPARHRIFGSI